MALCRMVPTKMKGSFFPVSVFWPSCLQHHNYITTRQENQITSHQISSVFPHRTGQDEDFGEANLPVHPADRHVALLLTVCFLQGGEGGIRLRKEEEPFRAVCFSLSLLSQEWTFCPCKLLLWKSLVLWSLCQG